IALNQSGAFEFVEPRQVANLLQSEVREERFRCSVCDRPAWRLAAAARANPAGLEQKVERAGCGNHTSNFFDLGPSDGLMIGDDRERLDCRTRQLARLDDLLRQQPGQIPGSTESPFLSDANEIDAACRILVLELRKRSFH